MEKIKLQKPEWFKVKGYLHLTPNIDAKFPNWIKITNQIQNPKYISKYSFFPLIHNIIVERRYKSVKIYDKNGQIIKDQHGNVLYKRSHKEFNPRLKNYQSTAKARPIHYATHKDSLIYSYYSYLLNTGYKKILDSTPELDNAVTAYRKITKGINKLTQKEEGKSTIDFAQEIFEEIKSRAKNKDIAVLAFDIEKFFSSLNHQKLKEKWNEVMRFDPSFSSVDVNSDHLRVFNATTNFSYILLEDLKSHKNSSGRKTGFDESKLAHIRKTKGFKCFFESNQDFRNHIREKKLNVFKNPFWDNSAKIKRGIPQGLPISATLANIYLLDFDRTIIEKLVKNKNCYYRRYSDDIIIICNTEHISVVKKIIEEEMQNNLVSVSKEKTETFIFKNLGSRLVSHKLSKRFINHKEVDIEIPYSPLKYLGFEFRGYNKNIKSANISKFYRKLINVVKRRARRAKFAKTKDPLNTNSIYISQIKKLYSSHNKRFDKDSFGKKQRRNKFNLKYNSRKGFYEIIHFENQKKRSQSNYFKYVERSSTIMSEQGIENQIRNQQKILYRAINKHLND